MPSAGVDRTSRDKTTHADRLCIAALTSAGVGDTEVAEFVQCSRDTVVKHKRRFLQSHTHIRAISAHWQTQVRYGATVALQRGLDLIPRTTRLSEVTAFMRACADYAGFQGPNESEKLASVKATYIKNEVHVHAGEGPLRTTTVSNVPVRSDPEPLDVTPQTEPSGELRISSDLDAEAT